MTATTPPPKAAKPFRRTRRPQPPPHPDPLIRPGRAARPPAQERRYPVPFGRPGYPMARILGSKRSVTKSTTRLTTVYPVATTRVKPMIAGKSRKAMESTT